MAMMKDPVCGMDCDPSTSQTMEYGGQTYYFCSPGCREEFEKNPDKYIKSQTGTRGGSQQGGGFQQGGTF